MRITIAKTPEIAKKIVELTHDHFGVEFLEIAADCFILSDDIKVDENNLNDGLIVAFVLGARSAFEGVNNITTGTKRLIKKGKSS